MRTDRRFPYQGCGVLVATLLSATGCGDSEAKAAQATLQKTQLPAVRAILADDMARHERGIRAAAARLAPGFVVEDRDVRERQMRTAMKQIQDPASSPKLKIPEFVASPMSFLAAVGADGKVIARDTEPDPMRGADFAKRYPVVHHALDKGEPGYALGEFDSLKEGGDPSVSMLFVAPVTHKGTRVGALVAGIPLWRMAQRISRQLRLEHASEIEKGLVLWAYLYRGDRVFHFGTPPELEPKVPDAATRKKGLEGGKDHFTGSFQLIGRHYAFLVAPTPKVGADVGVILLRADPPD